ncbi:MAG: hypothetical protein ACE5JQ_14355 [Candidatus Methylomirabilales bacterium]
MDALGYVSLIVGGFSCALNFYLSFLRYPLHKLRRGGDVEYRWVSGIPVVGSLLVLMSLASLHLETWLLYAALILMLVDTGGIHWFLGTMLYEGIFKKRGRGIGG